MAPSSRLSLLSEYRYEPYFIRRKKLTFLYVLLGIEFIHAKNTLYHRATPQLKVKFL